LFIVAASDRGDLLFRQATFWGVYAPDLAKHRVAMDLAVARRFRPIEKSDGGIIHAQPHNAGAQRVVDAVTDDQYFDLVDALRLHAFHRERERRGMFMRWNQHAGAEHGKS